MSSKANNNQRRAIKKWDNDGVNEGKSSLELLITWLREPCNYNAYRGGGEANGRTKETLLTEIRKVFEENGIYHRTNVDIRSKIQNLQDKFRDAHQFLRRTGQGIISEKRDAGEAEENIATSIKELMLTKFKFYYELTDVMGDRPANLPPYPNSTVDELDAEDLFFGSENNEVNETADDSGDDDDVIFVPGPSFDSSADSPPAASISKKRMITVKSTDGEQKSSKKVRKNLESVVTMMIEKSEEFENRRHLALKEKEEKDNSFRSSQLELQSLQLQNDSNFKSSQLDLQSRQLQIEEKRLAFEERRIANEERKLEIEYIQILKSTGYSNEDIQRKLEEGKN